MLNPSTTTNLSAVPAGKQPEEYWLARSYPLASIHLMYARGLDMRAIQQLGHARAFNRLETQRDAAIA